MGSSAKTICPNSGSCDGDGCYHHGKHKIRPDCKIVDEDTGCPKCKPVSQRATYKYVEDDDE